MTRALEFGPASLPNRADVVVIGAGMVGLSTAFFAAEGGFGQVIVVERRAAPMTLTSFAAAAGFRLEWDAPENISMVRRSIEFFRHFEDVVRVPGIDLDLHFNGYLFLSGPASDARREVRMEERVAWWRANGLDDVELLDGDEVRRRFPFANDSVERAHFRQDEGWVNQFQVARGLIAGGRFRTFVDLPVVGIAVEHGRVRAVLVGDGSRIETGAVVVAAGPFSGAVARMSGAELPIENRRRHGLIVPLPEDLVDPLWPVVIDLELGLYWRPRTEGLTTHGIYIGWERALAWDQRSQEPSDPVPVDLRYLAAVREHGPRLNRFWDRIPFEDVHWRAGHYTSSAANDGRPIIGAHPAIEGLFVNTGYEGRGIMAGPAGGELMAKLMADPRHQDGRPFSVELDGRPGSPDRMVL